MSYKKSLQQPKVLFIFKMLLDKIWFLDLPSLGEGSCTTGKAPGQCLSLVEFLGVLRRLEKMQMLQAYFNLSQKFKQYHQFQTKSVSVSWVSFSLGPFWFEVKGLHDGIAITPCARRSLHPARGISQRNSPTKSSPQLSVDRFYS